MAENDLILRTKDVAHILDCTPDDVAVLARKGKLKAEKIGGSWTFLSSDVATYKTNMSTYSDETAHS